MVMSAYSTYGPRTPSPLCAPSQLTPRHISTHHTFADITTALQHKMTGVIGIEFNIDWGTYKWVIAYTFTRDGERIGEPSCICIEGQSVEVPQMAAWLGDRLIQGFELEREISKNPELSSRTSELYKLLLYKSAETSELRENAEKLLAAQPGNKTLAYELQCALSYLVDDYLRRGVNPGLRKGHLILVADLGCGTGDFVLYRLTDNFSVTGRLEAVDMASGELCGSFQVDRLVYESFQDRMKQGWRTRTATKLSIGKADLDRRMLRAIEGAKCTFKDYEKQTPTRVMGLDGKYLNFDILTKEFHDALDAVIIRVTTQINKLCSKTKKPNVIALVGGFAKNEYLKAKLQALYDDEGKTVVVRPTDGKPAGCQPIAMGALLRYGCVKSQSLPTKHGYAYLVREELDPEIHTDSCTVRANVKKLKRNDTAPRMIREIDREPWVLPSPFNDKIWVVDDRLRIIVPMGTACDAGQEFEYKLEFYLRTTGPRSTGEFVLLTEHFEEHDRAKDYKGKKNGKDWGVLREGIQPWVTVDGVVDEKKLKAGGYKVITTENGEKFWKVPVKVVIEVREDCVPIRFDILEPGGCEEDEEEEEEEEDFSGATVFTVPDTVWDGNHTEFIE
ncbi:hypothetical protein CLAFUW4_03797 [Fulvia fulva]|uniref:Uncharacterized protein n=1 Tax=Passalora fulva TaxID=5499 RepID=A0A9Q8P515_PASFU|nr:uncharacterized protein CLAFUR5_03769 [Fulvia fulva]KAK4632789.1 hypothetical protein CLAFUR0_03784 [Fulvia fulva]UJO13439.1 hypothetical protein CLAFUR5_03769 [Fulvia fulva]WPV11399.1 hypothetical protein CLAFUW4_03797 [Fulvia fulva]